MHMKVRNLTLKQAVWQNDLYHPISNRAVAIVLKSGCTADEMHSTPIWDDCKRFASTLTLGKCVYFLASNLQLLQMKEIPRKNKLI